MAIVWRMLAAIIGVPLVLVVFIYIIEFLLKKGKSQVTAKIRPWLWLLPAFLLLGLFLLYPVFNTIWLSLKNYNSTTFVGLKNFLYIFTDPGMLVVLRNNLLWLLFFTSLTVVFGLIIAVLSDKVRYETVAKAMIYLPMAISFVAAGVIWKFMYAYSPKGAPQVGTLNAILTALVPDFTPQAWLFNKSINNFALIAVGIWMQTGFAMVILSAGLKGIPESLMEAARIDGATELQIFFSVTLPLMSRTITVVTTVLIITVLKIFDIVYIMTNGDMGTEVIANRMYKEMFTNNNFGRASAIAVILLLAIIPVMVMNIKKFAVGRGKNG